MYIQTKKKIFRVTILYRGTFLLSVDKIAVNYVFM